MANKSSKTQTEKKMEKRHMETVERIMTRQISELIEKGANAQQIKTAIWECWKNEPEVLNSYLASK